MALSEDIEPPRSGPASANHIDPLMAQGVQLVEPHKPRLTRQARALPKSKAEAPTPPPTVMSDDGLRYKAKKAGSPFGQPQLMHFRTTMSCFKCGSHRTTDELESKRMLGKIQRVCAGGCKKKA